MIEIDVSDPTRPVLAASGDPVGWPSAAAAAAGRLFTASGFASVYPMRLAISGDQTRSLPLPAIARSAVADGPQVSMAAGPGGLLVAHAEHVGGPLPSPTGYASATPRPTRTPTTSPTPGHTDQGGYAALLPSVRTEGRP
jgi:hypothetical protein